jgi:CRP-like cAMP-binding protein
MAEERPMRIDLGSDAPDPPTALIAPLRARATTAGLWRERDARRGERLLTPGDPPAVIVLSGGLVKLSYIAPAGDEWIKSFVADAGAFGAIEEESVPYAATCLEPSRVAALPAAWVRAALAEPALAGAAAAFNAWLLARKRAREEELLCLTAEERYRRFLTAEPALAARLPQGDIARWLRVTPVAFSRIKRRLAADG